MCERRAKNRQLQQAPPAPPLPRSPAPPLPRSPAPPPPPDVFHFFQNHVHVGTNNADRDGTTRIVKIYKEFVETLKKTRVEQIILSGILPVMRGRGTTFRNCKRMAINGLLEQMCEEEGVGFVDLWGYFVGKEDMFMRDGLHLSGKGAAVFSENLLRSMNNGTGCNVLN